MNCSTCGAPIKENGRYAVDLGMVYGFEAGQQDSTILRETIDSMLEDDEKYSRNPSLWEKKMKHWLNELTLITDYK